MPPLVSIIMPVYNRETLVARAVDSVLSQTYEHWEFLVVDDGSTDATRRVLEAYGARLTVLTQANAGPYPARNLALQQAQGDLIAFIDSDDMWYPHRLECQLPLLQRPEVGLVFGNGALITYREGQRQVLPDTYFDRLPPSRGRALKPLLRANFIPQSSVLVRRACLKAAGEFSVTSPRYADYAKWVQLAAQVELDYVPASVFEYAVHPGNLNAGLTRSFFLPVGLFEQLAERTAEPDVKLALRQRAVDLELELAFGLLREGFARFGRMLARPVGSAARLPLGRRLAVLADYFWSRVQRQVHRRYQSARRVLTGKGRRDAGR